MDISLLCVIAFVITISSFYFVSQILSLINKIVSVYHNPVTEYNIITKQKVFILVIAIVNITIFSKSSFLYPFNDWTDANCYLTVGKSILSGIVPYRDLFEQIGPLLYFIHTLAAMISYDSFIGVYFIEIIACYMFLYYSYKILLMCAHTYIIYLLPLLSFIIYSSHSFCHGDNAIYLYARNNIRMCIMNEIYNIRILYRMDYYIIIS